MTPNDPYMGRTAPLTSKHYILYIYSTNIGTEYFKHALYPPFFSLQNAVCFIMLTCFVPVSFTFYIHGVLKLKKNNSSAKRLRSRGSSVNIVTMLNPEGSGVRVSIRVRVHCLLQNVQALFFTESVSNSMKIEDISHNKRGRNVIVIPHVHPVTM